MSFTQKVKKELSLIESQGRHCMLAELGAMISLGTAIKGEINNKYLNCQTENINIAIKYFTLVKKTFNINTEICIRSNVKRRNNKTYILIIKDQEAIKKVLQGTKIYKGVIKREDSLMVDPIIVQNNCCKRAFIRGLFLSAGSISNPKKAYHFEIAFAEEEKAEQLKEIADTFSISGKIILRKNNYVFYIKEGTQIVDILNVMGAHNALMDFENVRILKEVRNSINRQVNCEAANIGKTVAAATKQIEDINYIKDTVGFGDLPNGLKEVAILRVDHPGASLAELGKKLSPTLGKSGVNHRLRRLCAIANQLRNSKEE